MSLHLHRCSRTAAAAAMLAALGWHTAAAAYVPHPEVVAADAVDTTPHLVPDATVTRPRVDALVQAGDTVFAGGLFGAITDPGREQTPTRRWNLASFDATSGELTTFAPVLDGRVHALEATASSLYVGGDFTSVDGVARHALVKLDLATGAVDTSFDAAFPGGRVNDLQWVGGRLLVGGTAAKKLIALDPETGADTGYLDLGIRGKVEGSWGTVSVNRFAVNREGTQLAAVGNFTTVSGRTRHRAFVADLHGTSATLNPWYYVPLTKPCASTAPQRQAYLSDVDYAPDGSYFVVSSTGSVPRLASEIGETLCDAVARFDVAVPDPERPVWINYTGGDSVWSVAATGAAVYAQGHFQYLDNPYGNNTAGPGAVRRVGVGAVDPVDGKALEWNPGSPARIGGKVMHVTDSGIWFGSDSLAFAGEPHRGVAFAPIVPATHP